MVAYNFQTQFAPDVEAGRKRQTIRSDGKRRHAQPGEMVQLYTGMRTKACRQLGTGVCTASDGCEIREDAVLVGDIAPRDLDGFARADGFRDFDHMKQWFRDTHGLPFTGRLIAWEPQP